MTTLEEDISNHFEVTIGTWAYRRVRSRNGGRRAAAGHRRAPPTTTFAHAGNMIAATILLGCDLSRSEERADRLVDEICRGGSAYAAEILTYAKECYDCAGLDGKKKLFIKATSCLNDNAGQTRAWICHFFNSIESIALSSHKYCISGLRNADSMRQSFLNAENVQQLSYDNHLNKLISEGLHSAWWDRQRELDRAGLATGAPAAITVAARGAEEGVNIIGRPTTLTPITNQANAVNGTNELRSAGETEPVDRALHGSHTEEERPPAGERHRHERT